MKNDVLPIGSVITVDEKDLMICSYLKNDALIEGKHFDYICCLYPIGLTKDVILVNKENIKRIKFIGYQSPDFIKLKETLKNEKE